jgi:HK97 family phage prohead protease
MTDISTRGARGYSEHRNLAVEDAECRMEPGNGGMTFRGYASIFESKYAIHDEYGSYQETVKRGAFDKTLAEGADVIFLINHDGAPLARTKSGTLHVRTDGRGLLAEARLDPSNPRAQELKSMVERADMDEMSMTFRDLRPTWNDAFTERSLTEVSIHHGDVSAVNFAANPATAGSLAMRARGQRAQLTSAEMGDMDDSAFAYIEPGGTKDSGGKTVPRSKRHFAIHDPAHVRAALARMAQGAKFSAQARPKVLAAAAKFGIKVGRKLDSVQWAEARLGERRSPAHKNLTITHTHSHAAYSSQGTWKTHSHTHSHAGDATHDHHNDDDATSQTEDPTDTMGTSSLSAGDWDLEARVRIARLKSEPAPPPLTPAERLRVMTWEQERRVHRRLVQTAELRSAPFHLPMIGEHIHAHGAYGNVQVAANKATNKKATGLPPLVHAHAHVHGANGVPDSSHDHDHIAIAGGSSPNVGAAVNKIADKGKVGK